jgi:hypothetical protein
MKDKINVILSIIPLDIRLPWKERWKNHNRAAGELEQLMCNEVVRTIIDIEDNNDWDWNSVADFLLNYLKSQYPESTIKTAIEKYKEENK